ncbi:MAG: GNAT family N-acetyltransferase [Aquabacterium sp.]
MPYRRIVQCSLARHGHAILDIFNEAIVNSTALYDYAPRTLESMDKWFEAKRHGNFPVIGVEDEAGALLAFGSYGPFRAWPAYKYTVEHSVYVEKSQRGGGLGRMVMQALIQQARLAELHVMMAAIDGANSQSIALHEKLGFQHVGTMPQIGFKFGRWLDVAFYQLILDTPSTPKDG